MSGPLRPLLQPTDFDNYPRVNNSAALLSKTPQTVKRESSFLQNGRKEEENSSLSPPQTDYNYVEIEADLTPSARTSHDIETAPFNSIRSQHSTPYPSFQRTTSTTTGATTAGRDPTITEGSSSICIFSYQRTSVISTIAESVYAMVLSSFSTSTRGAAGGTSPTSAAATRVGLLSSAAVATGAVNTSSSTGSYNCGPGAARSSFFSCCNLAGGVSPNSPKQLFVSLVAVSLLFFLVSVYHRKGSTTIGSYLSQVSTMTAEVAVSLLLSVPPVLGIFWAVLQTKWVHDVELKEPAEELKQITSGDASIQPGLIKNSQTVGKMQEIANAIAKGADAFLRIQYAWIMAFCLAFSVVIYEFFSHILSKPSLGAATVLAFLLGALTSILSGYIGMKAAVMCNLKTAHQCWAEGIEAGYAVAVRGGSILGFALVSLGIGVMLVVIKIFELWQVDNGSILSLYEALAGFGLGGSAVALFGRVGGGIYTKAADVGADLSGKNEWGMDEDDPRNPACIADNVGDNVGDIAGMGADLFGSFAEATCAAMIIAAKSFDAAYVANGPSPPGLANSYAGLNFPILISSLGVLVGLATMGIVLYMPYFAVRNTAQIEGALKAILIVSTVLESVAATVAAYVFLPSEFRLAMDDGTMVVRGTLDLLIPIILGLWGGLIIGIVTEYYTSHSYRPVREISETQQVSAATGIIYGLALGYLSCIIPILVLVLTVLVSHNHAGMYGVALAALGMLSTLTLGLTIDAYGPISDNAGGIAEMSGLGASTRELTDALDAAGNTTAAIGKGFAIGSAALVSLALFGAFKVRAGVQTVDVSDPLVWSGLLVGAMLPYAFSAMTMKSVGVAAQDMVNECMRQFPLIVDEGREPDYDTCIKISTEASLREMILPGALVIFTPIFTGLVFGKECVAGLLSGILVSGVQLAISMSNTGGAWDNAKKYIEKGGLGPESSKGSKAHQNAVTGDTVGDPLKDTSGPSLNILVKLSAIISLVFAEVFISTGWLATSNAVGGAAAVSPTSQPAVPNAAMKASSLAVKSL